MGPADDGTSFRGERLRPCASIGKRLPHSLAATFHLVPSAKAGYHSGSRYRSKGPYPTPGVGEFRLRIPPDDGRAAPRRTGRQSQTGSAHYARGQTARLPEAVV